MLEHSSLRAACTAQASSTSLLTSYFASIQPAPPKSASPPPATERTSDLYECQASTVTAFPSFLRRIAIERRQFMRPFHPGNALGDLNVSPGRDGVRVVVGRALDVDDPGQHLVVGVEDAGAAIGAKMPPAIFGGRVNLRRALRYPDGIAPVHGPADHWGAGTAPTIRAMA